MKKRLTNELEATHRAMREQKNVMTDEIETARIDCNNAMRAFVG
jgi:hypothetical protein